MNKDRTLIVDNLLSYGFNVNDHGFDALEEIIICSGIFSCKPDVLFTKIPSAQTGINFSNPNVENEDFVCL